MEIFFEMIEYLTLHDAFIANNLERFGDAGTISQSYLSSGVSNEFAQLMATQVGSEIILKPYRRCNAEHFGHYARYYLSGSVIVFSELRPQTFLSSCS